MNTKISPSREYTLGEIVRLGLMPGVDTIPKASRLVKNYEAGAVLQPIVETRGMRGIQYKVKGENIRKYLKKESKHGEKKHK